MEKLNMESANADVRKKRKRFTRRVTVNHVIGNTGQKLTSLKELREANPELNRKRRTAFQNTQKTGKR